MVAGSFTKSFFTFSLSDKFPSQNIAARVNWGQHDNDKKMKQWKQWKENLCLYKQLN